MGKKQYNVRTAAVAATERRARRSGASVVAAGSGSSYNEVYGDIAGKLDRELFDSMFERVSEGVDAEGVERWHILAKSHLVSVGDVTAYGNGGPGGGGSTGDGVTELRCLDDVILTNPKAGQILKYDGQHWVNGTIDAGLDEAALAAYLQTNRYAKLSDIPSLADYATRSWVEDKGYATETWVIAQRYLTEHQDISHLLTRAEFEAMFERVDTDGGGWYILAKSHLASVGDVTAYGTGGPGSTLGGIGDVQFGSLAAGDVIKWDGQHWVNGPAPAGGVDESVLANYVTLGTAQVISGVKTFAQEVIATDKWITAKIITGETGAANNTVQSKKAHGIELGYPNRDYMNFNEFGGVFNFYRTNLACHGSGDGVLMAQISPAGVKSTAFIRQGGTAAQFLKADGSVDNNRYTYGHLAGFADFAVALNSDFVTFDGSNPANAPVAGPWYNGFASTHSSYVLSYIVNAHRTNNWYVGWHEARNSNRVVWTQLVTSDNIYNFGDSRYVNKAGDTMTGPLRIAHSATNCVLHTQYNTAGTYSSVIWANVDESRVLFGSPHWITVELETANSATAAYRRTNGVQYKIWDSGNHGHTSGLNADLLDGHHGRDFFRHGAGYISSDYFNGTAFQNLAPGAYIYVYGGASGLLVSFGNIGASASSLELYTTYPNGGDIHYRKKIDSNRFAGGWNTLITNINIGSYNAGSATKLQTARSLWGNNFDGTAGCGGGLTFDRLTGTNARNLLYQKMADNDFFRIRCGGSASNAGWVEIATADDGTEPIYVRQYTGEFVSITRTLTLLDGSGNTYLPGHLVASGDVTAYSDARLKSDVQTLRNRGYITPRTYIKDGKRCIGFLAQEVRQRYPELVTDTGGADHWLALNYGNLVAVLEAQIIDHEERIKRLEGRA